MSNHDDDSDDVHVGIAARITEDGVEVKVSRPHKANECAAAHEAFEQEMFGHETVYEAKDAAATRASVGYSKSYASNYDAVFGKN